MLADHVTASGTAQPREFGVVPTAIGSLDKRRPQHSGNGAHTSGEAGQLLAPLERVGNYSRGVWVRLRVLAGQSIRFRFASIRGHAAAISLTVGFQFACSMRIGAQLSD